MAISRRGLIGAAALGAAWGFIRPVHSQSTLVGGSPATPPVFSFSNVIDAARELAARPFEPPPTELPKGLADLTYDAYRKIRFRPEAAVWADTPSRFRLDLFHRGFFYKEPVRVTLIEDGATRKLGFSPDMFSYDGQVPDASGLGDLDFAGFRARYPINGQGGFQEVVAFLGASYFRAVARDLNYGLSARGLAIDTAEPSGEEFPAFRSFWIERPAKDDDTLLVAALLDSPSVAGAYRFAITPGSDTVIDVEAELFVREDIAKIGIAPLTSMFLFDGMNRAGFDDYRKAVHDSDGLQMLTSAGEWIWRPLANPDKLQISYFGDRNPQGFGLGQRARRPEDFDDTEANYERRPGVWIEPKGDWGAGHVELVEIPSDREYNDNIVAYWRPDAAVRAGTSRHFAYRMRWTDLTLPPIELLWVAASRSGLSFDQQRRLFAIDFRARPGLPSFPDDGMAVAVTTSAGEIVNSRVQRDEVRNVIHATFELDPQGAELCELRLVLTRTGKPVSETWLYQWTAQ